MFTVAALSLTGCSREKVPQPEMNETWLPLTVLEGIEPAVYPFADPSCQTETTAGQPAVTSVRLNLWHNGEVKLSSIDLKPLNVSGHPLKSPTVSKVKFDAQYERTCDTTKASPPDCRDHRDHPAGWQVIESGRAFKICKTNLTPPRESMEHVAMAATIAIERASKSLKNLLPRITDISPIEVLVMPRFNTRWSPWTHNGKRGHYLTHMTDSMAYFPETNSTAPSIAVFPQSVSNSNGVHLWESEFVLAHEFAHHVERKLGLDRRGQNVSIMRVAASEAFADSMAFASQNAYRQSIEGIPCIGQDRAPDSLEFTNGTAKIMDDRLMRMLQGGDTNTSQEMIRNCQGVIPHSAHGLGTIFAHWLYEFAKDLPGYDKNPGQALATMTAEWLQRVDQDLGTGEKKLPEELALVVKALESTVEDQYNNLGIELSENLRIMLCQKMSLAFPALKERTWFSRTDC